MYPSFGILLIIVSYFLRKHFAESEKTKLKLASVLNEPLPIQIINIFGSVKKDNFKIEFSKLIYIKSEDNYVFIYYLKNDEIKNKMLRSTLSNIHKQIPKLIKTHRSFLVNPEYIKNLKGNSQNAKLSLHIDSVIIPVSKTYYNTIKSAIH
jgi:DNA-binding LytR/AlgR family response regulator